MEFSDYLKILASKDGSDLYLSTGAPPCAKFQGVLRPLEKDPMPPGAIKTIAYSLMDDEQRQEFEHELEMNLSISLPGVGRFRINIFRQRNEISIVARNIKMDIPQFDDLGLPPLTGGWVSDFMSAEESPPSIVTAAVQRAYLTFLAHLPDSHIVRKHGAALAHSVMRSAQLWQARALAGEPLDADPQFAAWDLELKAAGLNPGTSADLTVAALFVAGLVVGWHGS